MSIIAGELADLLGMDAFGAGQIPEDLDQLEIVVRLHLLGERIVAMHRIGFDLIRKREQVSIADIA